MVRIEPLLKGNISITIKYDFKKIFNQSLGNGSLGMDIKYNLKKKGFFCWNFFILN